jgi:hypothetical protein
LRGSTDLTDLQRRERQRERERYTNIERWASLCEEIVHQYRQKERKGEELKRSLYQIYIVGFFFGKVAKPKESWLYR